mmetsp:Transcript_1745/g.4207  ORF Transcript_1745/g.4207 Transcript_1745/m.4207 type:complete len:87 (+) Transcript_1745:55-315(+)
MQPDGGVSVEWYGLGNPQQDQRNIVDENQNNLWSCSTSADSSWLVEERPHDERFQRLQRENVHGWQPLVTQGIKSPTCYRNLPHPP